MARRPNGPAVRGFGGIGTIPAKIITDVNMKLIPKQ